MAPINARYSLFCLSMELLMLSPNDETQYVTPRTHKRKIRASRRACNTQAIFFCCSVFIKQIGGVLCHTWHSSIPPREKEFESAKTWLVRAAFWRRSLQL